MIRRTAFMYGGSGSFSPELPPRPWVPSNNSIGGSRVSAAGVPASYIVRQDFLVEITLRLRETELSDLANLIAWGQSAESFDWLPDADDPLTAYSVYLEAPAAGERWTLPRVGEFPRIQEVSLTLRGVGVAVPWPEFF